MIAIFDTGATGSASGVSRDGQWPVMVAQALLRLGGQGRSCQDHHC
jgi:hypothetical protein